MTARNPQPRSQAQPDADNDRPGFAEDFRRFFLRGLAAIAPTLITLSLVVWVWNFLWDAVGRHIIYVIRRVWYDLVVIGWVKFQPPNYIRWYLDEDQFTTRLLGVVLAIVLIYIVGVFVGNLLGRTAWLLAERAVMRIPFVRAIYPAVKQVTDFLLADRTAQFSGSSVVAVQPHEQGIWSVGLVTGRGTWTLDAGPEEMVTVFVPSTPTAFSGYVLVVPRKRVVPLPMTVEEALRLLISGGVITPGEPGKALPGAEPGGELAEAAANAGEAAENESAVCAPDDGPAARPEAAAISPRRRDNAGVNETA